jgi:hypothetical protein
MTLFLSKRILKFNILIISAVDGKEWPTMAKMTFEDFEDRIKQMKATLFDLVPILQTIQNDFNKKLPGFLPSIFITFLNATFNSSGVVFKQFFSAGFTCGYAHSSPPGLGKHMSNGYRVHTKYANIPSCTMRAFLPVALPGIFRG